MIEFDTACSKESLVAEIRSQFCAKVILVNHEKRIEVDTACSNLAIKYNMLYLSVYQLIKKEVCAETELGKALAQSKSEKSLNFGPTVKTIDPFQEADFSAAHYDMTLVMRLLQQKIAECRTNQRFILLEGFCNSGKLDIEEQSLQLRYMDEFFAIEKCVGEVVGVIGLQNEKQPDIFDITPDMIQHPVAEEVKAVVEKKDGDDDEEQAEAPPEDAAAKPKWRPTDYKWTITNGKAKNLP